MGWAQRLNTKSFKKKIGTIKPKVSKLDKIIVPSARVIQDELGTYLGLSSKVSNASNPIGSINLNDLNKRT